MIKRMFRTLPGVMAGACLALGAGFVGAQTKASTTPPQAYPKGQAVGAEGKPLTPQQCREHMAMAKDGKTSNDPVMKRRGEQCAELLASSQGSPGARNERSTQQQQTPPQAYPQGQARGAQGKAAGAAAHARTTGDAGNAATPTPPQAYPQGQAAGAEGTASSKK